VVQLSIILACFLVVAFDPPPESGAPAAPSTQEAPSADREAFQTDEKFEARLRSLDAAMAKVTDLRADFEQRKHTPLLKRPLVSRGVVLTRGDLVHWDTRSPHRSSLLIGGGTIRMYYPADKLVEEYPVGEGFKDLAGAPLPRLMTLRERFDITPLSPQELGEKNPSADLMAVQLTPKSEELRRHVTHVKVLIDESRPAATKVIMTDPDGEVTEITFANVRLNTGVSVEEVSPRFSEDVRVSRPLGEGKDASAEPGGANSKPDGKK
jgi:outer membrane lipoprotein-sorting protein